MFRIFLFISVISITACLIVRIVRAEEMTFTQTVRLVRGTNDTEKELRKLAILKARQLLCDETISFLEQATILAGNRDKLTQYRTNPPDSTSMIAALAANVTKSNISSEKWEHEEGVDVLYLSCTTVINSEEVNPLLQAILNDPQKLRGVQVIHQETSRILVELEDMKKLLDSADPAKISALKERQKQLFLELSAVMWYEKGLQAQDAEGKIKCFTSALKQRDNLLYPYLARGAVYLEQNETQKALVDVAQALLIDPGNIEAQSLLGAALLAIGDYEAVVEKLTHVMESGFDDASIFQKRGTAFVQLGKIPEALADYNRAIQLDSAKAVLFIERSRILLVMNESNQAFLDLTSAIKLAPNDPEPYYDRGRLELAWGDLAAALQDFNDAIVKKPDFSEAYLQRGLISFQQADYYKAAEDYNQAVKLKPDITKSSTGFQPVNDSSYTRLQPVNDSSYTHFQPMDDHGRDVHATTDDVKIYTLAITYYMTVLGMDLNNPQSYFDRAMYYEEKDDLYHAVAEYSQILEIDPHNYQALTKRCNLLRQIKNLDSALDDAVKITEFFPDSSLGYDLRASIYREVIYLQKALKDHNRALELDPDNPILYFHRGLTYEKLGMQELAKRDFYRAQRLGSQDALNELKKY